MAPSIITTGKITIPENTSGASVGGTSIKNHGGEIIQWAFRKCNARVTLFQLKTSSADAREGGD